ncbi:MAG: undecaprenyldiphospho-muramoylpentapeptide beta-N-acetylglucosaminyltransferase [Clostridia bacterium]|nr:undecaprenyldiphospho-muramoylpentapeptide beta-N-acetylglucosaminyltransferase [Clostridia bacterium]
MRVLLTGGGTAGHINPAVAIAKYIKEMEEDCEFLFVGTERGLEKTLVPKEGFEIEFVKVSGLKRKLTLENVKVLMQFVTSKIEAGKIIDKFKPDIVIGTGGYACTPAIYAAHKRKIPTLIHEQNVYPGLAIKMLAKKADVTMISFPETEKLIEARGCALTGNPLRPNLFDEVDPQTVRNQYGFDSKPLVLFFGGSLGAERMNDALVDMLHTGFDGFNLVAATGEKHFEKIVARLDEKGVDYKNMKNLALLPYIYNMNEVLGASDVAICRAGAITISELNALGKASVLVPSPYVAHNHQEQNARYLEKNGAAKVLVESELNGMSLKKAISDVLGDRESLLKMRDNSLKMGQRDACAKIYAIVKDLVR